MSNWQTMEQAKPPENKVVEVAIYGEVSQLATFDHKALRFRTVPTGFRINYIHSSETLWREIQPSIAPTRAEHESPQFSAEAASDEPAFLLLARDPIAAALVEAWAYMRMGQYMLAKKAIGNALSLSRQLEPQRNDDPQILSAFRVAGQMLAWAKKKVLAG